MANRQKIWQAVKEKREFTCHFSRNRTFVPFQIREIARLCLLFAPIRLASISPGNADRATGVRAGISQHCFPRTGFFFSQLTVKISLQHRPNEDCCRFGNRSQHRHTNFIWIAGNLPLREPLYVPPSHGFSSLYLSKQENPYIRELY